MNPNLTKLPKYVWTVFYTKSSMLYQNSNQFAISSSQFHTKEEVRAALTWLVKKFDGQVEWRK